MATENMQTVEHLNSFLRGELSAVASYRWAIDKLPSSHHRPLLEECQQSHAGRVTALIEEVQRRGGAPAKDAGMWGAFTTAIEAGAAAFGERAAVAALEEGEDHGRDDYLRDLGDLDDQARSFVEQRLLPEQRRTHAALSGLKKQLAAGN
jgi:hypothetical protein